MTAAVVIALIFLVLGLLMVGYILWARRDLKRTLDPKWREFGTDENGVPTWEGLEMLMLYRKWFLKPPEYPIGGSG